MDDPQNILGAIYRAVDWINDGLSPDHQLVKAPETRLVGPQSVLDSIQLVSLIPCAAIRLRQPRDQRQFHREFRQFCRQRLQEFQIPVRIRLVENEMYGERFKKNRRGYA